jgi:hypothetical protein
MKRTIYTLLLLAFGAFSVASCDLNNTPVFSESDAFVAVKKSSLAVKESVGTIQIPVQLSSISGVSSTVSYKAVNGTAVEGTDFELVDGSATLTFSASERVQYIAVKILPHTGVYTGDLNFAIQLSDGGSVALGNEIKCTVTINDLDHPLAAILGTYTATGNCHWDGIVNWQMEILKDATDVTKVWFYNICYLSRGGWDGNDTMIYGIVNEAKTQITVPLGQSPADFLYSSKYHIMFNGCDKDLNYYTSGSMTIDISADNKTLTFDPKYGFWVMLVESTTDVENTFYGNVMIMKPGITAKKN